MRDVWQPKRCCLAMGMGRFKEKLIRSPPRPTPGMLILRILTEMDLKTSSSLGIIYCIESYEPPQNLLFKQKGSRFLRSFLSILPVILAISGTSSAVRQARPSLSLKARLRGEWGQYFVLMYY